MARNVAYSNCSDVSVCSLYYKRICRDFSTFTAIGPSIDCNCVKTRIHPSPFTAGFLIISSLAGRTGVTTSIVDRLTLYCTPGVNISRGALQC